MELDSTFHYANGWWTNQTFSGIVKSIFGCGCTSRDSKHARFIEDKHDFLMCDSLNPMRRPPHYNYERVCSEPYNVEKICQNINCNAQDSFKLNNDNLNQEFTMDNSDMIDNNKSSYHQEYSYFIADGDNIEPKHIDEERLSFSSKKISRKRAYPKQKLVSSKKSLQTRRPWQSHEDARVIELLKQYGPCWATISKHMDTNRTGKQIRDRYLNKLDPKINNMEWTEQEDALLVELFKKFGKKWCEISKNMPGRTESMVKNRVQWRFRWMLEGQDNFEQPKSLLDRLEAGEGNTYNISSSSDISSENSASHYHESQQGHQRACDHNIQIEQKIKGFSAHYQQIRPNMTASQDCFVCENQKCMPEGQCHSKSLKLDPSKLDDDTHMFLSSKVFINSNQDHNIISIHKLDDEIENRINCLSGMLKDSITSDNFMNSVQQMVQNYRAIERNEHNSMSREEASSRVDVLKSRLLKLENLLCKTIQEVKNVHYF